MTASQSYITAEDYMDNDVAYLLGMLFGRGQLIEDGDGRRAVIALDIRRKLPKLPPGTKVQMDLDVENERSLGLVRGRVNELLDANVDIRPVKAGKQELTAIFVKRTIAWRDLKLLCSNGTARTNFRLPKVFFEFNEDIHREFLRGFADVAVMPSWADNAWGTRARIAFPVVHPNIYFARQLRRLLRSVGAPAELLEGTAKKRGSRKEHRIRLDADKYEPIGFHFPHKQRLLELLSEFNRQGRSR